ncbi:hypothetical protein C8Q76DRAFT_785810 [Earliella scabrosa]|nr:hypothetical protein C8Q76DRAFT_785810 [Earliella scabrosa]
MSSCSDIPTLSGSRLQSLALCPHESYNPASSGSKLHGKKHAMPWCCLSTTTLKASMSKAQGVDFSAELGRRNDALIMYRINLTCVWVWRTWSRTWGRGRGRDVEREGTHWDVSRTSLLSHPWLRKGATARATLGDLIPTHVAPSYLRWAQTQ